ncbi:MAG: DUF5693 family protein [Elusimicrobiota bacterium]
MRAARARIAALAVVAAVVVWETRAPSPRAVLPAVEADAFAALYGRAAASTPELWERFKAMGVAAVVLHEETAAELAARGEVLYFSRAEVEKWRTIGLAAEGGGPKPDSLWARDAKALTRLAGALAARGIDVSTATAVGGGRSLELPSGVDLSHVPAGFDPEIVSIVSAAGLITIAASTGSCAVVAGHTLWIRSLPASARPPELLRAVNGRAMRLLILRPSAGLGLDANLERLRAALKTVKSAGLPGVLPAGAARDAPVQPEQAARLLLFYAIGLFGPLLAVRVGLEAERTVRGWVAASIPISAPVVEVLAGVCVAWAAATAAGLLAAAALAPARREELARAWTLWTLCAPMIAGAAALFACEGPAVRARWRAPLRMRDLAAAIVMIFALSGLLAPRAALRAVGIWEWVDRFPAAAALWWWPWRWREILIGTPSLVLALILVGKREISSQDGRGSHVRTFLGDPRGWLILGLLAPAGAVASIGAGGAPIALAVAQGAAACALGAALGFILAGLRSRLESWVLGPTNAGPLT